MYQFNFGIVLKHLDVFVYGVALSLKITIIALVIGITIGLIAAILSLSKIRIINILVISYVEFFRCTPVLVQLIWVYYALPAISGISINAFFAVIIALSLNSGAFYAEAFRAGIQAVPKGQDLAAISIGMSNFQKYFYIILPQGIRNMIPMGVSLVVSMFKESSLVSTLGVFELMYRAQVLAAQTYRPFEVLTLAAGIYFIIAYPFTLISRKLEKRISIQ